MHLTYILIESIDENLVSFLIVAQLYFLPNIPVVNWSEFSVIFITQGIVAQLYFLPNIPVVNWSEFSVIFFSQVIVSQNVCYIQKPRNTGNINIIVSIACVFWILTFEVRSQV